MKLSQTVVTLLALGFFMVACNTAPPPPPALSFKLKPAEVSLDVSAGAEATSFVALERDAGFTDLVQMTFQDLPAGFSQEWTRDTANGDCGVRIKVDKSVAPGTYILKVIGFNGADAKRLQTQTVSANVQITTDITVNVNTAQFVKYAITTSPSVFSGEQGFQANFGVNVRKLLPDFNGSVQLTLENLPLGVGVQFAQNPLPFSSLNNTTTLNSTQATLTISNSTLPNTYAMRLVGVANGVSRSTVVNLTVLPATTIGFRLSATPIRDTFSQELNSSLTGRFNVQVERKQGFTAPINLSAQNLALDMRTDGLPLTIASDKTSAAFNVIAGFNTPSGPQTFTVKAIGGGVTHTVPVTGTVLSRFEQPDPENLGFDALDPTFSNIPVNGFRAVQEIASNFLDSDVFNTELDKQFSSLALANGKVLISAARGTRAKVARLNADGTFDSSFGVNGISAELVIDNGVQEQGKSLGTITGFALQSDSKILVIGGSGNTTRVLPAIARLNSNGSLDSSFGNGGVVVFDGSNGGTDDEPALSMALVDLGRVMLKLIRLTPGGNLDPDFSGDGRSPIFLSNVVTAVTDSLGRFIVICNDLVSSPNRINTFRVLQTGGLDVNYQTNGILNKRLSGRGVALDSQNRLLLPVQNTGNGATQVFSVMRLTNLGLPDSSFDTDGQVEIPLSAPSSHAVTILSNDKVMVVGRATHPNGNSNANFAAVRLNTDGSLDAGFGNAGKFLVAFTPPNFVGPVELFNSAITLADNSVMAFGQGFGALLANNNTFLTIAKFKP